MNVITLWKTSKGLFKSFDQANKRKNLIEDRDGIELPQEIFVLEVRVDGERKYFALGEPLQVKVPADTL